jgi:hypothetical protein
MKVMQMVAMRYHSQMFLDWKRNWQNEFYSVPIINHDISFFSGGSDKITYAVSGSHLGQEGIIGGDKSGFFEKYGKSFGADIS